MDHDEMRRLLRQRPFQPFRVIVGDGRTFEIRHPGMNLLAPWYINIGIPAPELTAPICDHTEFVPLSLITAVEPLPTVAPPTTP